MKCKVLPDGHVDGQMVQPAEAEPPPPPSPKRKPSKKAREEETRSGSSSCSSSGSSASAAHDDEQLITDESAAPRQPPARRPGPQLSLKSRLSVPVRRRTLCGFFKLRLSSKDRSAALLVGALEGKGLVFEGA